MWLTFALTIVIAAAWFAKMIAEKQFRVQRTPLDLFLGLFFLSQVLATLISLDSRISLWGYYSRFNGGLLSLTSYIFLYYAFVSNYFSIDSDGNKHTASQHFSNTTKIVFFLSGLIVPLIGIFLFSGKQETSSTVKEILLLLSLLASCFLFVWSFSAGFLKRLLSIILTSGLLVALWGIPSHFGADPTCYVFRGVLDVSCWTDAFKPTIRMFSTLGQPAWLAAYVSVLLPISIALFMQKAFSRRETLSPLAGIYGVLTILLYLSLLFANTRAGFLGFWIGMVTFWTILWQQEVTGIKRRVLYGVFGLNMLGIAYAVLQSNYIFFWFVSIIIYLLFLFCLKRIWIKAFVAINMLLLALTFFFSSPLPDVNRYFSPSMFHQKASNPETAQSATNDTNTGGTESGSIRRIVWKGAIDAWKANALIGTGVETFAFAYYKHRPAEHNLTSEWDYLYNKAHNEYLNYLTTTGILGAGTYIGIIGGFLFFLQKHILQTIKKSEEQLTQNPSLLLTYGLLAGFISILVSNFFGFSVVIINLFLFLIPAFVFLLNNLLDPNIVYAYPKKPEDVRYINISQWFGIAVVMIISIYSMISLGRFWQADKAYALGSNLARGGDYQGGYLSLQEATMKRRTEPVFKDELSGTSAQVALLLFQQQEATTAAEFAQQAVELNNEVLQSHPNNVVFWKSRVRLFYTLSQIDPNYLSYALQAAEQAAKLAPTDAKILYNLGVLYGQTGQSEKAIKILEQTTMLKPDYEDAYFALGLFYRDAAVDDNDFVTDPVLNEKAIATMQRILKDINPENEQAKTTLKEWGVQ